MTATPRPHPTEPRTVGLYEPAKRPLRISIVLEWARALLGAGAAVAIGAVIDRGGQNQPLTAPLVWLTVLLVSRALLSAIPPLSATETRNRVESDLRRRVLEAALDLGPWSGRRTGDTLGKATEGVEAVGALAGTFLPQLVSGMSTPVLLGVVVALIDWPTALVLTVILPLIPLLLRLLERRFASVSARYRATADQLAARFLDGVQGLRTLKILNRADRYGDALAEDSERLRRETMGLLRVNQLALLAVDTSFTLGTVAAAAVMAAIRLSSGAITVGQAVAIVILGLMFIEPLGQIGRFFYVGAIGRAAAAQMKDLFDAVPEPDPPGTAASRISQGDVVFSGVSFTYPDGTRAVDQVSFTIRSGERVAVVGPSGAGKTTVAHLLVGLLHPESGLVQVGGHAVLVPQRPYLFHGTIADNLRLARPDASDQELWSALEVAGLSALVQSRASGLDSPVGERGLRLSGGEVQRLAIARALLVDAKVVVLDEPTSNIDLESEARIRDALDRLTAHKTLVVIAHRRSTVAHMDRALLLQGGRITDELPGSDMVRMFGAARAGR